MKDDINPDSINIFIPFTSPEVTAVYSLSNTKVAGKLSLAELVQGLLEMLMILT